jgi:hypothetical protein
VQWATVLDEWVQSINDIADLRTDLARIADYAGDVVDAVLARSSRSSAALTRFGQRLGVEGWPLDQVSTWIDLLAAVCPPGAAADLRTFEHGAALARGWTEGHLRGLHTGDAYDAVTGLCTPSVLRLRLEQVFDQMAALRIASPVLHRLVIVDVDIAGVTALEADAVMVVLSALVQRTFAHGETIARDGSRIFVLAANNEQLASTVERMIEEAHTLSLLAAAGVLAWVQELPAVSHHIDSYIADIAA